MLVLGQHKHARDHELLRNVSDVAPSEWRLQIAGRGWPGVDGWDVIDRFLSEGEMDSLLDSASVVLIPYQHYFQSGIAVRAFEAGVPVVGNRHEFLESLYGKEWPGLVDDRYGPRETGRRTVEAITQAATCAVPEEVVDARAEEWRRALDDHDASPDLNEG